MKDKELEEAKQNIKNLKKIIAELKDDNFELTMQLNKMCRSIGDLLK